MSEQFWLDFLDTLDVFQSVLLLIIGYAMGIWTMILAVMFGLIWKDKP